MRNLLLAAAAATFLATPAFAQDNPDRSPFTGARVGAILGYDGLQPGSSEDSDIRGDDQTASGLAYGADIGYDFAYKGVLIGAEGEVAGSTSKVRNPSNDNFGFGRVKAGRDLYIGGRVGFLATPNFMVYAKGGYTNTRLDLTAGDGDTETGRHYNLDGYRVGAGVETALTHNVYAKVEYRYSNYGQARLEFPNGENTGNFSIDTDRHQVVVGVGLRF